MDDFSDFSLDARYAAVYVVFSTFFDLPSQDAQVRCFASVARHLNAGGVFVIEAFVPDHARLARGWADWAGSPFTSKSTSHVSVYEKPAGGDEGEAP